MTSQRPSTPPGRAGALPKSPMTPEEIRRREIARLKAKEAWKQNSSNSAGTGGGTGTNNNHASATGQKRPYSEISHTNRATERSNRDASKPTQYLGPNGTVSSNAVAGGGSGESNGSANRPLDSILQPARNFTKYVEYDFSKMTDTKGGFLTSADDPHNRALKERDEAALAGKPAHMTLKEWERHRLLTRLREERKGPYEPGIRQLEAENKPCRECGTLEIDWKWEGIFGIQVCSMCKDKLPEKYSLLTKTEVKEDYLLTDSELRDPELLPHLSKPNPHKSTWNNMMLFLRCQVEEYALGPKRWGSEAALDEAFEKRQAEAKRRKSEKFRNKLQELKKRTRVEAWKRAQQQKAEGDGSGGGEFGDVVGEQGRHVHEWGRPEVDDESGVSTKRCVDCGLEMEELEL